MIGSQVMYDAKTGDNSFGASAETRPAKGFVRQLKAAYNTLKTRFGRQQTFALAGAFNTPMGVVGIKGTYNQSNNTLLINTLTINSYANLDLGSFGPLNLNANYTKTIVFGDSQFSTWDFNVVKPFEVMKHVYGSVGAGVCNFGGKAFASCELSF